MEPAAPCGSARRRGGPGTRVRDLSHGPGPLLCQQLHLLLCGPDAAGDAESLYFKDDDARLSFLMGNYLTLTSLSQREVQRIIDLRISPINVSVHTTDQSLRVEMLKNRRAGEASRSCAASPGTRSP